MHQVTTKLTFTVPSWNFCNYDTDSAALVSNHVCRFCEKTKYGYRCQLFDAGLQFDGTFMHKVRACCRMTAGFDEGIQPKVEPKVDPRDLAAEVLKLYRSTVRELVNEHYPQPIAENLAYKQITGGR